MVDQREALWFDCEPLTSIISEIMWGHIRNVCFGETPNISSENAKW